MSEQHSYWPRFFKRVFSETALFTTRKLLVGAVMGIITRIALLEFGKKALEEVKLDTMIFIGSYITATIFSFLINLVRVPALLDAECQREIRRLSAVVEGPDKAQADHLRQLLAKLNDEGLTVLKLALFHDELNYKIMDAAGLSPETIQKGTRNCLDSGLLHWGNNSPNSSMGLWWMGDFYWISPEIRLPLSRLIHEAK